MDLILETTTGLLQPAGTSPALPRGGTELVSLRFLTMGVAGLLPDGTVLSLSLYAPSDLVTPLASCTDLTASVTATLYRGSLDTLAGGLAALQRATLFGRITYGVVNSGWFLVNYGQAGDAAGAPPTTIVITQPTGPVNYVQDIGLFAGKAVVDQVEGFWRVKAPCQLLGLQLNAQDAPTGANLLVDVVKGGVALNKIATLAAAAKTQETIFGAPVNLQIGDVVQFKPTQIGSVKAGTNLAAKAIVQLL